MLTLLGSPRRCCDGVTRRETLKAGVLSFLGGGFNLPTLLAHEQANPERRGRARHVILLYLMGGAATQDMVDLKPDAPVGIRSDFRPIETRTPGIRVCEHLPQLAQWTNKMAIVRSVNHRGGCHNPVVCYTGDGSTRENIVGPAIPRDVLPSMGSVCEWLREGRGHLSDYVYLPCYLGWGQAIRRPGPGAGFLGQRYDPFCTEVAPYRAANAPVQRGRYGYPVTKFGEPRLGLSKLPAGLTVDRLNERRGLVEQLDEHMRNLDAQPATSTFSRTRQFGFDLLTSSSARAAFDLRREPESVRNRYGRTLFGNCALIGRRLVEAGVRFVNVTWDAFWERGGQLDEDAWDTHWRIFSVLREVNLPEYDRVYAALLEDLEQRGLLDETLVVTMSEMGRTPRVHDPRAVTHGTEPGRDHWTYCYSVWFAGAGIRGGTLYGRSDSQAAFVQDRPVSPADICATIYECLGIDPDMPVYDQSGRPHPVANGGRPIRDILA